MHTSRRKFIQITGCLTIGFSIGGFSSGYSAPFGDELPESLKRNPNINAWLGAYANIFAIESFMDELCEIAGKDSYEFRLMHLENERAKDVIGKLREITRGEKAVEGTGIGIAFPLLSNTVARFSSA